MNLQPNTRRAIPLLIACMLGIPQYSLAQSVVVTPATASTAISGAQEQNFTQEQLDQMLAPIALYPDAVLSQILMASTYPLEVVEADRWCTAHPALTPDELQKALGSESWDASVKSLCSFGPILDRLSRDVTWTQNLGEAFIGQQAQVMDAIQDLRHRARNAGSLVSNAQQLVTVDNDYIAVVPRDPQVVYVPTYDPNLAFGTWWWPAAPYYPADWWPPGDVGWYWGAGLAVGLGLWGVFDWHHHRVDVDLHRYNHLYGSHLADAHWRFNPMHRAGVGFRNPALHGRFDGQAAHAREQFREPGFAAHGLGEPFGRPELGGEHLGGFGGEHVGGEHLGGFGGEHVGGEHFGGVGGEHFGDEHLGGLGGEHAAAPGPEHFGGEFHGAGGFHGGGGGHGGGGHR
jgi:hypothetical protein